MNKHIKKNYTIQEFPDQNKYILRVYNAQEINEHCQNLTYQYSVRIEKNTLNICFENDCFYLSNLPEKILSQYISGKGKIGISFLDNYHEVLTGFYLKSPK